MPVRVPSSAILTQVVVLAGLFVSVRFSVLLVYEIFVPCGKKRYNLFQLLTLQCFMLISKTFSAKQRRVY